MPQIYREKIVRLIGSTNQNEYEQNRKATGLSKPLIISGLKPSLMILVPLCFSLDFMHLIMNLAELHTYFPLERDHDVQQNNRQ